MTLQRQYFNIPNPAFYNLIRQFAHANGMMSFTVMDMRRAFSYYMHKAIRNN